MDIELSNGLERNSTAPGDEATLRWIESCIESARHRRKERLLALLEVVEAELIFEAELAGRREENLLRFREDSCQDSAARKMKNL
ncbi:MAG: hypothetical protein ACFB50_11025 [Rubrobacteraceae bacterium]